MPPQRTQKRSRELKPTERAFAHGMVTAGKSYRTVAQEFDVSQSTISRIITNDKQNPNSNYQSLPRPTPRKTTKEQDHRLQQEARKGYIERRVPLGELHHNVLPQVSRRTVQRRLKEDNVQKYPATERPALTPKHKKERLEWAHRYKHYTPKDWEELVVFSDEVSVAQDDGKTTTWVFRSPKEKWHQDCYEPVANGSRLSVMFWGCIIGKKKGALVPLCPDEERTGKKGITTDIILDAYKQHLPQLLQARYGRVFMQDNARVHTSKVTMDWLDEKGYSVMTWPPYSPDLNPIEGVWYTIKVWIAKHYPEVRASTFGEERAKALIVEVVEAAWEGLLGTFDGKHASSS